MFELYFYQVANVLLKEGTDVLQQDCYGNNIVHSLIMQAFYHPQLEQSLVDNFNKLVTLLPFNQVKTLLRSENMYKLRAVEFAAQHGVCRMVVAIMNVPGVHLYRIQRFGIITYKWYDVTEYETSERGPVSPLVFLTFVDKKTSTSSGYHYLHSQSVFTKWFDAKFRTNRPFIVFLFLLRLIYITTYFVYDMDTIPHGNSTDHCEPAFGIRLTPSARVGIGFYLFSHAAIVIVVTILEMISFYKIQDWSWNYNVEGKRLLEAHDAFFWSCNFCFSSILLAFVVLDYTNIDASLFDIAHVLLPISGMWNILYFVQMLPSIGYFVITVQAILGDLWNFSVIFIIMMIPYMHSFQIIVNTNTNEGCFGAYDTLFQTFYSLFSIMLNMVELASYNIRNLDVLLVAHVVYTFTVSIMMINFFIALLSHSVSIISKTRRTTLQIRRSTAAFVIQKPGAVCKGVYQFLMSRNYLFEGDRILLMVSETSHSNHEVQN